MELSDIFPYRKDVSYAMTAPGAVTEYETSTRCSSLEFLQYRVGSGIETTCIDGLMDETNLDSWLARNFDQPRKAAPMTEEFAGGLRLMVGLCEFNTTRSRRAVPFSKEAFERVQYHLGMPDEFKDVLVGTTGRAFKFSCPKTSGGSFFQPKTCFVFRFGIFRPSYYQLALSHDPHTNLTTGLLLSKTADHEFPLLIQSLKAHQTHCLHPLLTPALLSKIIVSSTATRIQAVDRSLNELEETAGQHEYINIPVRSPLELDFMAATRRLNFVGRTLGVEKMRAEAMILSLKLMQKEAFNLQRPNGTSPGLEESTTLVDELITCHINAAQNLALRAEYEEKRTQTQLAVVYQFMTQKEAIITSKIAYTSATIASESKKDSSAMKAIAVLTMFFLPGTFLATIFAMPVFDWNTGSRPVVKNGFRCYWAIAVPLTILVLFLWGLSVWLPWKKWVSDLMPKRPHTKRDEAEDGFGTEKDSETMP